MGNKKKYHWVLFLIILILLMPQTGQGAAMKHAYEVKEHKDGYKQVIIRDLNKELLLKPGNTIFYANGEEYYTEEPFVMKEGVLDITEAQQRFIEENIANKKILKVHKGVTIDRVKYHKNVPVFTDLSMKKIMEQIPVNQEVRVLETVLDGYFKVMTPAFKIGYMDARFVKLQGDTLPAIHNNLDKVNKDKVFIVSQKEQKLFVYAKREDDEYDLEKEIIVSTGLPAEHTPNGYFLIKERRGKWFYNPKYQAGGHNYVEFKGSYLLHSVATDKNGKPKPDRVEKLGQQASMGCIGMPIPDSKYIYDHAKANMLLVIDHETKKIEDIFSHLKKSADDPSILVEVMPTIEETAEIEANDAIDL